MAGEVGKQLGVSYFLERRELGVINIGGAGTITVDGQCYEIDHREALYVGKGAKEVVFASIDTATPAKVLLQLRTCAYDVSHQKMSHRTKYLQSR